MLAVGDTAAQLNTDRLISIGRNALYFKDYVLSIQYFNQVIRVKPFLVDPYFYRAIAKIELEDYVGAETDLDVVIERNPFIPMAYYARGFSRKNQERWDEAEQDFAKALEYSPDNAIYTINRVEALRESRRYVEALADIDALLRKYPESVELTYEKGALLLELCDTVQAAGMFDRLVELDSDNPETWAARALMSLIAGNEEAAMEDYNKAVKMKSQNVGTYINRGILNYRRKNYRAALADYDRALQIDSTNKNAIFNRALLRSEVGDYDNALADLTLLTKINPMLYEAVFERGRINDLLGNNLAAIDDYSRIIERYPTFIPALYARADVYDRMGRTKAAYLDREKAADIRDRHRRGNLVSDSADTLDTSVKVAGLTDGESMIGKLAQMFNSNPNETAQNGSGVRGMVQNNSVALENEPNIVLSYYRSVDNDLPIEQYNPAVLQQLNASNRLHAPMYLVAHEVKLSSAMINHHFRSVNSLSSLIAQNPTNADLYLARAYDYALVQDFNNAIEDFSKAVFYGDNSPAVYFSRANVRYKRLEFLLNGGDDLFEESTIKTDEKKQIGIYSGDMLVEKSLADRKYSYDFELIMRDYDKTIELAPDFAFAWYNRANMLVIQKDYRAAISNYTQAVAIEPNFGEAYFNRGLTYILLGDFKRGSLDLSKAGELGIYKAYSILKKIQTLKKQ